MKQNLTYLFKGLFVSTLLMVLFTLLSAFLMWKVQWGDSILFPLLLVFFCLSVFVGGWYFAKHASARRFLWGILFGAAYFAVYLAVTYFLSADGAFLSDNAVTFLTASLGAGCLGGMLS